MTQQPIQPSITLGSLSIVDPRLVWPKEEKDFTPWLAQNIDKLSEALGIELNVLGIEKKVGNYELDIYATDKDSGDIVIVENQLEETDHKHMGQLMAYAAGTEAKVIVWVTPKVREEHIATIEWLNRVTLDTLKFFLVRVEVIKIDASLPAVRLDVEVAPSDFARTFEKAKPKSAMPNATRLIWSDTPATPLVVKSWRDVFRRVLERAAQEGFDFQPIVKSTTDPNQASNLLAAAQFQLNGQVVYVEMNYSATDIVRRVRRVLQSMNKSAKFVKIECDNNTTVELP